MIPTTRPAVGLRRKLPGCFVAIMAFVFAGCHSIPKLPQESSNTYTDFVSAFYIGLAALQVGDDARAQRELERATEIVPGEPAAWANWGLLALRQRGFDVAAERLNRARGLAPQNDAIYYLLGLAEAGRGNSTEAIADLRKAVSINPQNLIAMYRLAEEVERRGDANSDAEFHSLIEQIAHAQPENVAVLLELSRISAKRGDAAALKQSVAAIHAQSRAWPPKCRSSSLPWKRLPPNPIFGRRRSIPLFCGTC